MSVQEKEYDELRMARSDDNCKLLLLSPFKF
jgi:hypothetical protein